MRSEDEPCWPLFYLLLSELKKIGIKGLKKALKTQNLVKNALKTIQKLNLLNLLLEGRI